MMKASKGCLLPSGCFSRRKFHLVHTVASLSTVASFRPAKGLVNKYCYYYNIRYSGQNVFQNIFSRFTAHTLYSGIRAYSSVAARFPYDAGGLSLLKKHADTALYEVKERGRNGYLWYMDLEKKPE